MISVPLISSVCIAITLNIYMFRLCLFYYLTDFYMELSFLVNVASQFS